MDTSALVDALRRGTICGVAIDVPESEPLTVGHALTRFDSVVLAVTPLSAEVRR